MVATISNFITKKVLQILQIGMPPIVGSLPKMQNLQNHKTIKENKTGFSRSPYEHLCALQEAWKNRWSSEQLRESWKSWAQLTLRVVRCNMLLLFMPCMLRGCGSCRRPVTAKLERELKNVPRALDSDTKVVYPGIYSIFYRCFSVVRFSPST